MSHPFLTSMSVVVTAVTVVSLLPAPVMGQAPTAAADTWTSPRTSWGHPDLQGIWTNETITPFERPGELQGKPFPYRRRSLGTGTANSATEGCCRWHVPTGQRWRLQPASGTTPEPRSSRPGKRRWWWTARWESPSEAGGGIEARRQPRTRHRLLRVHELVGPLHHARCAGFDVPHRLQQCLSDPANSRLRGDSLRDDPRRAHHPAGWPSARRTQDPPLDGRLARPLGGRYASRRHYQFH